MKKRTLFLIGGGVMALAAVIAIVLGITAARGKADSFPPSEMGGAERQIQEMLLAMTTEDKISQLLMPELRYYTDESGKIHSMDTLTGEAEGALRRHGFAGVALFIENLNDTETGLRLIDAMQRANASAENRSQLLMGADQEGGSVIRLGHGCQMTSAMGLAATGDPATTEKAARLIAEEVLAVGVNYVAAPVADVNNNPNNPVIGIRAFSDDPETVSRHAVRLMTGLKDAGVVASIKHFPGHGDVVTNSHSGLPSIDKSYEQLKSFELLPFQACIDAGAEAVMTAHIQFPQIEKETLVSKSTGEPITLPATMSKTILTDILRGDMGFTGVVITDALNMGAVADHFEPMDIARLAILAGADILLIPVDTSTSAGFAELDRYISNLAAMADAGELPMEQVDAAVRRILTLKQRHGLLEPYNGADLEARVQKAAETVGSPEHHAREWDIVRAGVTLLKNQNGTLPVPAEGGQTLVLVPFASQLNSVRYAFSRLISEGKLPADSGVRVVCSADLDLTALPEGGQDTVSELLEGTEHLVAVSNAYSLGSLDPAAVSGKYAALLDALIAGIHDQGGNAVVISAELPYDAARYPEADAILVAWHGKGMPENPLETEGVPLAYGANVPAALCAVFGPAETFTGRLSVDLPAMDGSGRFTGGILYTRGDGLER